MPLGSETEVILGDVAQLTDTERPDFVEESIPAIARQFNPIFSTIEAFSHGDTGGFNLEDYDPDYDPFAELEGTRYEDEPELLNDVWTREQRAALDRKLDEQDEDIATVAAGGLAELVAAIAIGAADPLVILPFGAGALKAIKGANLLRRAAITGRAAFLGMTAQEAVLQATQELRTLQQGAVDIAAGTFLGGVLGGTISTIGARRLARMIDDTERNLDMGIPRGDDIDVAEVPIQTIFNDTMDGVSVEEAVPLRGRPGFGAIIGGSIDEDVITGTMRPFTKRPGFLDGELSAMGDQLASAYGLEKLQAVQGLAPGPRIQAYSFSVNARRLVQELAETAQFYAKNEFGKTTGPAVETLAKRFHAMNGMVVEFKNDAWLRYRARIAGVDVPETPFARAKLRAKFGIQDFRTKNPERLTLNQFGERVDFAARNSDIDDMPVSQRISEVSETASYTRRTFLDPTKDEMVGLKMIDEVNLGKTAPSYMPRAWVVRVLHARRPEWLDITENWLAVEHADLSDTERIQAAVDIFNSLTGSEPGRIRYNDTYVGKASPFHGRTFNAPDKLYKDFIEHDFDILMHFYARSVGPDIELTKRFGSIDMKKQIQKVRDEYDRFIDINTRELTDADRTLLASRRDRDIRDIEAMRDRLRGTYGRSDNPHSMITRTGMAVRRFNYLTKMGGVAISSMPDMANIVMANGLERTIGTATKALSTDFQTLRLSRLEVKLAGTGWDMALNTRAEKLMDIGDDFAGFSKFERGLEGLSNTFSYVNLLAPWNATIKQFSGIVTTQRMIDAMGATRISSKNLRRLAQSGIEEPDARRIMDEFNLHGETTEEGLHILKTEDWGRQHEIGSGEYNASIKARDIFRAALAKEVDTQIVTPGIADTPLWMSSEMGRMLGQFKTFMFASTQRLTMMRLQQADQSALNGAFVSAGIGSMVYMTKALIAGRPISSNPAVILKEAVDFSGMGGFAMELNNYVERLTRNSVGLSRVIGEPASSRYVSRRMSEALFGPTVGTANQVAELVGTATGLATFSGSGARPSDAKAFRRILPYQNTFWADGLFDAVEDGLRRMIGEN